MSLLFQILYKCNDCVLRASLFMDFALLVCSRVFTLQKSAHESFLSLLCDDLFIYVSGEEDGEQGVAVPHGEKSIEEEQMVGSLGTEEETVDGDDIDEVSWNLHLSLILESDICFQAIG